MNLFKGGNLNSQKSGNLSSGSFWFLKSIFIFVSVFVLFGMSQEARAQQAGALDPSFLNGRVNGANNEILDIVIQSDGKSIITGSFTEYNTVSRNRIARINADGSLDTTFNPGTGADNNINSASVQSDGKIVIGGYFITYNGATVNRIAKIGRAHV